MNKIWAVAKNTIAQGIRMKIAVLILVLLFLLLPFMAVILSGDGSLLGKLQNFSSYGISLISMLLCVLTISVSCFTLSNDLKRKYLDMVLTKPIYRYQVVLGKTLGVILMNLTLLAFFSLIVFSLTYLIPWIQKPSKTETGFFSRHVLQIRQPDAREMALVQREFFTARKVIQPLLDKEALHKQAVKKFEQMQEAGTLPENLTPRQVLENFYAQEVKAQMGVDPFGVKEWTFQGIPPTSDPNAMIYVRFTFNATPEPPDAKVFCQWRIGDFRQFGDIPSTKSTPILSVDRAEISREQHVIEIPAAVVAADGMAMVAFRNNGDLNQASVLFTEIELLYEVGSFANNFFRIILLIAVRLVLLAVLGVSLSTWLSFPVGMLASLLFFSIGLIHSFLKEAIDGFGAVFGVFYDFIIRPLLHLVPQFDGPYSPTDYIVSGEVLQWTFIMRSIGFTICLQALILLLFGLFIFSRRETGKITV